MCEVWDARRGAWQLVAVQRKAFGIAFDPLDDPRATFLRNERGELAERCSSRLSAISRAAEAGHRRQLPARCAASLLGARMAASLSLDTLHQVALGSSDLTRAVAFYRDVLGLELIARFEPHAIHRDDAGTFGEAGATEWMAFLRDPDGNVLALASRVPPARNP